MADKQQIIFGGFGPLPPKKAEFKKPKPGERPLWLEVLEEAFFKLTSTEEGKQLYGDPEKGGTLEQIWRTNGLFTGKLPVCLLSNEQPLVPTDAIDRVIKMSSKEVVNALIDLFGMNEIMAFPIAYHDGYLGHSITLLEYDKDTQRFTYLDPWPGNSLLCKDFNAAGVDAQLKNGSWSITSTELEKVIFAAFVQRPLWSEYMGEKYYMTYDEFMNSDFWTFFHLAEVDRETKDRGTNITLKTGGFQTEIDLNVTVNQKNRLVKGLLNVKRSWVVGPPYGLNPFALDIVRSFIAALTPPPDQDAVSRLINMFHQIQDPAYAEQLINEGSEKSTLHRALFTYLGPSPSFEAIFQFSNLSMKNLSGDGEDWLQTLLTIDAL
ncbi:MAG: hypothetical protein EA409_00160 [Saprospirales bacterium]|nr:MAG: hypothetical protein EA409_00160 [Saprospirales bacterium]